jgi:MYXO-CTERM domain-containing protein
VGTAFAGECINKVNQTPNTPTPEPGGGVLLAVGLLGLVALTGRRLAA